MYGLDDDFKGFGEGFDGFPKRLPEDCVEYSLYIINSKLKSQKDLLSRLEDVRKESLALLKDLTKDYIWQRDGFKLEVKTEKGLMHLNGITNYGDSVEDEWLIVYILKELSSRFPTLWIKVVDSDGEFLLIEAANALPKWLNPEIADNRVWIHNNALHIIPLRAVTDSSIKSPTAPVSRSLTLEEAHRAISSTPEILIRSPLIEAEAFYRLRSYPAQIAASLHHACITIPRKLAYILHLLPTSIAPAVEAFYLRDSIALKPLQTASPNLIFPPKDLVTISIRYTKVLYAQLKSQQFTAPFAWKDILTPPKNDALVGDFTKLEMGMKVTSGFEMLVTDPKNGDHQSVREINILLEDLDGDDSNLPNDEEISTWKDNLREDDEKWLDINFEDFERELDGKNKKKEPAGIPGSFGPEPASGFGDAKTEADLKKMVERFEAFLNDDDAGPDGAEMDDMDIDDDDEDSEEDKDVSFDEVEFAKMMREMMGMPTDDIHESASPAQQEISRRIEEVDSDDEGGADNEAEEIRKVMKRMEAELNEAGALNLDPTPSKIAALSGRKTGREKDKQQEQVQEDMDEDEDEEGGEEESDQELDIDFNLAKNLLESFKSQAGMAGPGSNLLGMMGMKLPRDEDDEGRSRGKRPE
ncbi:36bd8107-189f-40d7-8091-0b3821c3eacd [Sclerotinia trifoliorum]|uniref:36bd8107-189f-40d7-8091-0b3821c3eacd n=1 Tax=Sclerotinia trifoliorum TaxID=28548 RepID=A0A8H2ZL99_9HELO|nr:36bd8107-189f-40d7-8091-0b3821c3eacd [Sclerotinia trifoliorum]